jgi:hypothetical protein
MTTETWSDISDESDAWVDVIDGANGYVAAGYVVAIYVSGVSGVVWSDASDESTAWSAV